MSHEQETFFTSIGCMDGRVQGPIAEFGKERFNADYPDTITGAGLVGKLAKLDKEDPEFQRTQDMIEISLINHGSKGVLIHGHEECAGNPVAEEIHKQDIRLTTEKVQEIVQGIKRDTKEIPVVGVYVKLHPMPLIEQVSQQLEVR